MDHFGYYHRFIYVYTKIFGSLYTLLTILDWTLILRVPNLDTIFHVHIDALPFAIGNVLTQLGENNVDFLISYASCQLHSTKNNYTTIKRGKT